MNFLNKLRNNKWLIKNKKTIKKIIMPYIMFKSFVFSNINLKCNLHCTEDEIILKKYVPVNELYNDDIFGYANKKSINLSIIIPVYNSEKYLERCINSLLNQKTKYEYEIILINDGSKDSSVNILEKYKNNSKIRIYNQHNHGISYTRNKGIRLSKGEYIGFVDNDDYVDQFYVQKLLYVAYKNKADYVKCGYSKFNKSGIIDTKIVNESVKNNKLVTYDGFIWGGIIKRNLFDKIRFPEGFWYEDIITKILVMRSSEKFIYVPESLYFYFVHSDNASVTVWKSMDYKCLDQYYLVENLCKYGEKIGLYPDSDLYDLLLRELGDMLWERTKCLESDYRKAVFIKSCKFLQKYEEFCRKYVDYEDRLLVKAFNTYNYQLWKNISHLRRIKNG